ncbi:hypothetical protein AVEN_142762-1 [Araneus ventricosus]|uniref:Mos1 transposase HTH domain-containing protein n=1 Tax=Araneus ventricosus TaxID=182803 RepID=A0A4Y2SJX9_ARAVE|nr:hypothetical protein AVEN_142762-1 [Araneus ventricosus]
MAQILFQHTAKIGERKVILAFLFFPIVRKKKKYNQAEHKLSAVYGQCFTSDDTVRNWFSLEDNARFGRPSSVNEDMFENRRYTVQELSLSIITKYSFEEHWVYFTCERTKKLPRNKHNFLKDQRTKRRLYIGSLDINETKRLQNIADNADRQPHNLYLNHTQTTPNAGYVDYEDQEMDCSSDISEVDLNLDTYKPSTSNRLISLTDPKYKQLTPIVSKSSQMRFGLPSTAVVGHRFGVSDLAVAAIASSVLRDVGLITSNNSDLVVDNNKLRR